MFGNSAETALYERTAHLPLLLHPEPRRIAVVGSATGSVAGGVTLHPVEQIDLVEIVPEVNELAAEYFAFANRGVHADPRSRVVTEDGRNHLRAARDRYDVVIEDLFVPYRPSAAAMYSRDYYEDVRERLSEEGIFCQWLPVYQLSEETMSIIVATFVEVFPEATLWRPHVKASTPIAGPAASGGSPARVHSASASCSSVVR